MKRYDIRVRYSFEGTYTVAAEDRDEAKRTVNDDCGLVLGGDIHTTRDDDEVLEWDFCIHPDTRILSLQERGGKGSLPSEAVDFSGRIKELRGDIIDAIRQLLHAHCMKEIRLPEEDYDPVWVIWFGKNGEPYECRVTGLRVTADSLTVLAEEKESGDEVQCHSPFELGETVRILAINDINSELDDKEIDSWIRLTRVLTHEIMNSVTPITSLSDTLLSLHQNADDEIRNGLEVISTTGKSLISFVESYRKFTHIPTPEPTLFYVQKFAERMVKLARHHTNFPNITINVGVEPSDLIVYADENLISQVVLNLLKNAMQAIGCEQADGLIEVKAYCNEEEAVLIEVSNNGPVIPQEEAEHIFVPFFTTKEGGSGIGLSISRQIMRLSGGSIALKSAPAAKRTTFVLTFP